VARKRIDDRHGVNRASCRFGRIATARPNIISREFARPLAFADQFEIPERAFDIADQHRAGERPSEITSFL